LLESIQSTCEQMARKQKFNTNVPATIRLNLLGKRFGRLVVVGFGGRSASHAILWTCQCECGSVYDYWAGNLRGGLSSQCRDCHLKDPPPKCITHGQSKSPTYHTWHWAKRRNLLCRKWLRFEAFLEDMGPKPDGTFFCRKNQSRLHSPTNSYWGDSTISQTGRSISFRGRAMNLSAWAREIGITRQAINKRLKNGWPLERALTAARYSRRGKT